MALLYYVTFVNKFFFPASRLSHVRILQVTRGARIIKCIILMVDCNPERIMCL